MLEIAIWIRFTCATLKCIAFQSSQRIFICERSSLARAVDCSVYEPNSSRRTWTHRQIMHTSFHFVIWSLLISTFSLSLHFSSTVAHHVTLANFVSTWTHATRAQDHDAKMVAIARQRTITACPDFVAIVRLDFPHHYVKLGSAAHAIRRRVKMVVRVHWNRSPITYARVHKDIQVNSAAPKTK